MLAYFKNDPFHNETDSDGIVSIDIYGKEKGYTSILAKTQIMKIEIYDVTSIVVT